MIKVLPNRLWHHFREDSLFRNSLYLMISTGIMAFLGFIFWIFIARFFPTKDVGIATTLISSMTLLSNLSLLGFNISLIRYLPKSTKRNEKINSAIILVIIASVFSSIIFLSGLHIFSPKLAFLQSKVFYISTFIIFTVGAALNTLLESIFMAYRSAGNILVKNGVLSILKLFLPIILLFLGSYGVLSSVAIAMIISTAVGFIILFMKFHYQPALTFNKDVIKEMATFSGGNYIAGFLSSAPALILPLFIINHLSAETAAYFYMDMMILGFLTIISGATTKSLLAEGSHDETQLKGHFIKATRLIFTFLIPAIILIVLFGNLILHAFGKNYASDAFEFLQLISISAIFISFCSLGDAILRVRHKIKYLIMMNAIGMILVLGLSYLFINNGLIGIGWGWILGEIILSILYAFILWKVIFSEKKIIPLNYI